MDKAKIPVFGARSPQDSRISIVLKDGRRVLVGRNQLDAVREIIKRKAARRGSGSVISTPFMQTQKPPPKIAEGWKGNTYIIAHPVTGLRTQIGRKKIDKLRTQGVSGPDSALARQYIIGKKAPRRVAGLGSRDIDTKKPKVAKQPRSINGWKNASKTKYVLKRNDGSVTTISAKKINKLRAMPGKLNFSNNQLARNYNDRLQRHKAGMFSPKEKKVRERKAVQDGWTANKKQYMFLKDDGSIKRIAAKKIDKLRAMPGKMNLTNYQLARNYDARQERHRAGIFSPKEKKVRERKTVQEGWITNKKNKEKYVLLKDDGRVKKINAEKIDKLRKRLGAPFSNGYIARAYNDGGSRPVINSYNKEADKYYVVDDGGKMRHVTGATVRKAIEMGEIGNAMHVAKKLVAYRQKGASLLQGTYKTKIGDAMQKFPLGKLEMLRSKFGIPTLDAAAQRYVNMNSEKPPKGQSGWAPNMRSDNLDTVYYHWTGKGKSHEKIAHSEIHKYTNAGMSIEDAARRAMDKREPGWTKDGSRYFVSMTNNNNGTDRKLRPITKEKMLRIQQRLKSFGLPSNDTDAGIAWVKSNIKRKRAKGGKVGSPFFNYAQNEIRGDGERVAGSLFVPAYKSYLAANPKGIERSEVKSGIVQIARKDVVGNLVKPDVIEVVESNRPARDAADAQLLKDVPPAQSPKFKDFLVKVFKRYTGSLETRPLLAGNVGYPDKDPESTPLTQLKDATNSIGGKVVDGCKLAAQAWPRKQGLGLQVHQGVVYAMANLRARDKINTAGLAAIHSVGAGKTIEGLSVIVAFWNKTFANGTKPWGIFPMSVRSNQSGNDIRTLASDAVKFFKFFKSTYPGTNAKNEYPFAGSVKAAKEAIEARIIAGYRALGHSEDIPTNHLLGSFGTTAHDFYGDNGKKPKFPWKRTTKVQHAVFIVDEIQLLNGGAKSEAGLLEKEYPQIRTLLSQHRDPVTTWVVGLTATPGETLEDISKVMDYISGSTGNFGTEAKMRKNVRGLVSYAFAQADMSKFPAIQVRHECVDLEDVTKNDIVHASYADRYASTLRKYQETKNINLLVEWGAGDEGGTVRVGREPHPGFLDYDVAHKHKFWFRVRRASEYIQVGAGSDENVMNDPLPSQLPQTLGARRRESKEAAAMKSNSTSNSKNSNPKNATNSNSEINSKTLGTLLNQSKRPGMPIVREVQGYTPPSMRGARARATGPIPKSREVFYILSPKLIQIIQYIVTDPSSEGIHYVYSPDSKSLRLIAWILKTRFGFDQYKAGIRTDKPMFAYVDRFDKPNPWWYGTDNAPHEQYGVSGADVTGLLDKQTGILKGKKPHTVRVVLATRESYKGVDIRGITHLHLTSALPDYTDLIQFIGRSTRYCGHDHLRMMQRKAIVHLYKLVRDVRQTNKGLQGGCLGGRGHAKLLPDCYVLQHAIERFKGGWDRIERVLMEESVDYAIFKDTYNKAARELHAQIIVTNPCQILVKPSLMDAVRNKNRNWGARNVKPKATKAHNS
jgi:hypothetical protein